MNPADDQNSYENATDFSKGLTIATVSIVEFWEAAKVQYNGDMLKVAEIMDIFFLTVQLRLTGGSNEACEQTMMNSLDASDILNDRK